MPPSPTQKRRNREARLKRSGVTGNAKNFAWLIKKTNRINIVTEGDSWFAYPRRLIFTGPNSNVVDWIVSRVKNKDKVNLLRLASNGDEAVAIISGQQKHDLANILKTNQGKVHLLLFSAGGNDVVGKWDMERLLKDYQAGFTAEECVRQDRLSRKLQRITLAYKELLELRNEYSPNTIVVTHTYDHLTPSEEGAKFLWGLVRTGPWIRPYMTTKRIPENFQAPICQILLGGLRQCLQEVSRSQVAKNKFVVVDTQGTLRPGHRSDWLNEIHPTSSGFKRITKSIYREMKQLQPNLPPF